MINVYINYSIHGGNSWLSDVRIAKLWEKAFTCREFWIHKPNPNEKNIAIIHYPRQVQNDSDFPTEIWNEIKWCLDNNIRIFLDDQWETGQPYDGCQTPLTQKYKEFFLKNNIKILTNFNTNYKNINMQLVLEEGVDDLYVDSRNFFYVTRFMYDQWNINFKQDTYHSRFDDKRFFYNCLLGDISKQKSILLYAALAKDNLIEDDCIVTRIKNAQNYFKFDKEYFKHLGDFTEEHDLISYISKNKDEILQHDPFEKRFGYSYHNPEDELNVIDERRIPQEMLDCHFSIVNETITLPGFFTEKTYKHLIAKLPFLIYGGPFDNHLLAEKHGFEMYDELFDYSFEVLKDPFDDGRKANIKLLNGIIDNIKRLRKEPISIFNQPSLREKIEYNHYVYMKNTRSSKYKEYLDGIFLA